MSKTLTHEQIWGYVADQITLHDCPLKFNGLCAPDCPGHCRRHIEEMQTLAPPTGESQSNRPSFV